ncbi:MAG: hypothetical protein WKF83_08485 [Nocardioidaceae bacterium]
MRSAQARAAADAPAAAMKARLVPLRPRLGQRGELGRKPSRTPIARGHRDR